MKRTWILVSVAALASLIAVACAQPPQDDVNAAQAEMDKAHQAQADKWAPTEFAAADQAMNAAQEGIKAQNDKWLKTTIALPGKDGEPELTYESVNTSLVEPKPRKYD